VFEPQIDGGVIDPPGFETEKRSVAHWVPPEVLIFFVEFRDLSHLTRELSQAEKLNNCCYKLSNGKK
jgi:hypothetical protein